MKCPSCGALLVERPEYPFPVLLQTTFGLSFVLFLVFFGQVRARPIVLWAWSAVQIALGFFLVRARKRARRRVYHCIRCDSALR